MPIATQAVRVKQDTFYYSAKTVKPDSIDYPETDGKPMADSDFQRNSLTYLLEAFKAFYEDNENIYVSGDLLIYYEKGNSSVSVAPDVFVAFDVHKHDRRIYQTWKEDKFPDVVFEIASKTTYKKDEQIKPELYRRLGAQEYFQYDPVGDCFQPQLRGRFLDENGEYKIVNPVIYKDGSLRLFSPRLGVELRLEGTRLRIFDPKTKQYLLNHSEEIKLRKQTEQQVSLERQQKELALQETEQERQQKELALQQKELAQQKADKMAERLRALGVNLDEII